MKSTALFIHLSVMLLLTVTTMRAEEHLTTFNYSVGYTGSINKEAFIKNTVTNQTTDHWSHGIGTLWPKHEAHKLDRDMTVEPSVELDATDGHFRIPHSNLFQFNNAGYGTILDASLSYEGNAIDSNRKTLGSDYCSLEILNETHFDGFTVVWVDKEVKTISLPEGVTIDEPYCTYDGTDYYVKGYTYTINVDTVDKVFGNIEILGATNVLIAADKRSATFTIEADVTIYATLQTISGTCGDNATWTLSQDDQGNYTCLTISGSGAINNYDHTTDGSTTTWRTTAPWGWNLTSVTIGNEITGIGDYAFIGCRQLGKLSLGNGVTSIGTNAFDHCDGLKEVNLPANVKTLAAGAFKNSVNLQRVNIQKSDGLVSLTGSSAFDGCHSSLVLVVPTPALALQYMTAAYWSAYATKLRVAFGNYLFSATDEGGTPAYAIANATDLNNLSAAVNEHSDYSAGHNFRQTADITLNGTFKPIGMGYDSPFYDNYDGGGYTISSLNINTDGEFAGLFGIAAHGLAHDYTFDNLIIKNVILISPVITSNCNDAYVGALVAHPQHSNIQNCVVMNPIVSATGNGSNKVGAITGSAEYYFCKLANLYFYDSDASHNYPVIGYNSGGAEVTNVARARKVTFNGDVTVTPDANDITNGFVYNGESYYREGIQLTFIAHEGFDAVYSYTVGTTTTVLEGEKLTVPASDITVNATYTVKEWTGSGAVGDPYIIEHAAQLDMLAERVNNGNNYADTYFQLGADISYDTEGLSDTESNFTAIGGHNKFFNGHFDGANHVVSGIRIYKGGTDFADFYQGLFGQIGTGASVSGVILSDARITGYQRVGGIVGENHGGTVSNCHVLSDVTINAVKSMSMYHGGNVGSNNNGGIVTNCTGAATVTYAAGISYCQCYGGIVGENENATVTNCLYTGTTVSGNAYVGAVIGFNAGASSKVEDCYYTVEDATGGNGDTNCAIGETSEIAPDPEHVVLIDIDDLAPEVIATRLAPQDSEDNNIFVTLMARRAATLKAAAPQYNASVNLTLRGRTLSRDGKWHTICLPFDVTLEGSVLEGAEVRELTNAHITGTTLNLEFSNPVEKLIAGTPYIIRLGNTESATRAEGSAATELTNPRFVHVDIDDTDRSFDNAESGNQRVRFVGSYKMNDFEGTLQSSLLMSGADSPYYPTAGTRIGAFRAYFLIGDGDSQGTVSITDFNIKLGDDDYTGIRELESPFDNSSDNGQFSILNGQIVIRQIVNGQIVQYYDLNGRKLNNPCNP